MKKNALYLIGILATVFALTVFHSCTKDFGDPVEHNITYILTNNTSQQLDFTLTYSDPKFANYENFRSDTIMIWTHEFVAKNPYPCYLEVFSPTEGADFTISILQDDEVKETIRADEPFRDTTRAKLQYAIVR